jgi:DNA topoisomerase VI subunit B
LDAILQYDAAANVVNESFKSRKICENMLRMSVIEDPTTNTIEIICSDTGTGIQCRDVSQLCCGVFATSKINFQGTTGKYGML